MRPAKGKINKYEVVESSRRPRKGQIVGKVKYEKNRGSYELTSN
ncbi:hypothetical protein X474_12000 [Dethiosulfatarculus sandiegensis]|uniref:Uncharacterized protein n=1 Tax=Dethiosulfatarculus sandiegensis TaxID=1429043 RepID=A0A0D2GG56_9BACT|nr:hypothetical protein X474_12000 [Dethiosulfatarculus sandiegensis]